MITADTIRGILELYSKHGWTLRRVLLSDATQVRLRDDLQDLFGPIPIVSSDIDAAWFSRPSSAGGESWEIRHLAETPFALVETIPRNAETSVLDDVFQRLELRIKEIQRRVQTGH